MRILKILLIAISLFSTLNAGIFDLIKDIFKSHPQKKEEPIQREKEKILNENEIIIEEESPEELQEEEFIEKIPFEKYPYSYKIAFVLPKKIIGKYSVTTVNAALSYLIKRGINFKIDVYDIYNGDFDILNRVLSTIEAKNYNLIIAPVTKTIAQNICSLYIRKIIYIPTVNKNSITCEDPNIYFGGIDYNRQFLALSKKAKDKNAILIYDSSPFIRELNLLSQNYFFIKKRIQIKKSKSLKYALLRNKKYLQNSTIILNTPIIKSALFLSEAYFYSIKPKLYLSTQINYDPHIFLLTQYKTRKNMLIANSILDTYIKYSDASKILNADIKFNKVNYALTNGLDYFFINSYKDRGRIFKEKMYNNQIYYNVEIVSPKNGYFVKE